MGETTQIVSCLFFLISLILFLVAFGAPWWYHHGGDAQGLWLKCYKDNNLWGCQRLPFGDKNGQEKGVTIVMCITLVANITALVLYVMDFVKGFSLKIVSFVSGGAGIGTLLSIIIYSTFATSFRYMGWTYYMAVTSCIIQILTAVATLVVEWRS